MTSPITVVGTGVFSPKLRQASVVRKQVSQGGYGDLGLEIRSKTGRVDPDELSLRLFRKNDFDTYNETDALGVMILELPTGDAKIIKEDVGRYYVELGPDVTDVLGNLTALWRYKIGDLVFSYTDNITIMEPMPNYELLRDYERFTVQQVSWMFGDLFDSTEGGPNLLENFQTHYNYERLAQLLNVTVTRLNFIGNPTTSWTVGTGDDGEQVPDYIRGMLVFGLYLEVLKHFMRSYVEQPDFKNMQVTYTDRRDYLQRWKGIYDDEKREFDPAFKLAKRRLLGLAQGSLLVSGGIYGGGVNGIFMAGTYAAQVRSYRFYPATAAIGIVNGINGSSPGIWNR